MSQLDQISQLMSLASASRPLDLSRLVDGISAQLSASAHKDIAEAKEVLGEDADKYLPVSRDYYRNQREAQELSHRQRMLDLEFERARAVADAEVRAARRLNAPPVDDKND